METNSIGTKNDLEGLLIIDEAAQQYLKTTTKWSQFLSVLGFVCCGFGVLASLGLGFVSLVARGFSAEMDYALSYMSSGLMSWFYFLGAIIYGVCIVPAYYLYKFSVRTKTALLQNDNATLRDALKFQMAYFRFGGILAIVIIALYAIILIGSILVVASQTFSSY